MTRGLITLAVLIVMGLLKLPVERDLAALHRQEHFRGVEFNLDLREQLGQLGFIAALSGFRAIVADGLFIQAHAAWKTLNGAECFCYFDKSQHSNHGCSCFGRQPRGTWHGTRA